MNHQTDLFNTHDGSELHRLKPMAEYDEQVFNRLYKVCKPVIRNLSAQIDYKRYNLTRDIIQSYFWDKMLFVFNKYYGTCTEEHLKARLLSSLSTYKNKLLRYAYGSRAEYNQSLNSLEELYDSSKELEDDSEEMEARSNMFQCLYDYMKENLSADAYLLFEVTLVPPPYIRSRLSRDGVRITNSLLIDFFGMPRTVKSEQYISQLRKEVNSQIELAKKELHY